MGQHVDNLDSSSSQKRNTCVGHNKFVDLLEVGMGIQPFHSECLKYPQSRVDSNLFRSPLKIRLHAALGPYSDP